VLMFWQNKNTIVVGKNQNTFSEIDIDYVKDTGIEVVRRLTGGGAMYQDLGNLNFTLIVNNAGEWYSDFSRFTSPVVRALRELGVPAEISGRNDIIVNGKKISGNAQTVKNGRLLHHGTLLFNSNTDVLSRALKPDKEKIKSKGIASVSSRVANVNDFLSEPINCQVLISKIKKAAILEYPDLCEYEFTSEDNREIQKLADEKYSTWEWNYGYSPKYDYSKKIKFAGGIIEVCLNVGHGIINHARIFGDYFGVSNVSEIEETLVGLRHNYEAISDALKGFDLNSYFTGITLDELMRVMF